MIGAGLAGAFVAAGLREAGVDVVVLDARHPGHGSSGRILGFARGGLVEHPYRLVHALGEEGARALFRFTTESLDLLRDRVPVTGGGLWLALDERERAELPRSAKALEQMGIRASVVTTPLGDALQTPDDGCFHPLDALRRTLPESGVFGTCRVEGVSVEPAGCALQVLDQSGTCHTLTCEVVVYCAGVGCRALETWFEDKLTPIREQALEVRISSPPVSAAWAGQGYTRFRHLADDRLLVSGARWATPHLEVGESDETVIVPAIQEKLEGFARRFGDPVVRDRWAWVFAGTCDGLPIIGPLPGRPTLISCTGFVGNTPGLAPRAARAVVDGILTGRSPGLPAMLRTERFL